MSTQKNLQTNVFHLSNFKIRVLLALACLNSTMYVVYVGYFYIFIHKSLTQEQFPPDLM